MRLYLCLSLSLSLPLSFSLSLPLSLPLSLSLSLSLSVWLLLCQVTLFPSRLREALDLGDEDGALVLDVCRYILEEAAYYGFRAALLSQRLAEAGLTPEQVPLFFIS